MMQSMKPETEKTGRMINVRKGTVLLRDLLIKWEYDVEFTRISAEGLFKEKKKNDT